MVSATFSGKKNRTDNYWISSRYVELLEDVLHTPLIKYHAEKLIQIVLQTLCLQEE
jgi:hypothetical protein